MPPRDEIKRGPNREKTVAQPQVVLALVLALALELALACVGVPLDRPIGIATKQINEIKA